MEQFLSTNCYDIIDMMLWGAIMFFVGIYIAAPKHRNQKPNKEERKKRK